MFPDLFLDDLPLITKDEEEQLLKSVKHNPGRRETDEELLAGIDILGNYERRWIRDKDMGLNGV